MLETAGVIIAALGTLIATEAAFAFIPLVKEGARVEIVLGLISMRGEGVEGEMLGLPWMAVAVVDAFAMPPTLNAGARFERVAINVVEGWARRNAVVVRVVP